MMKHQYVKQTGIKIAIISVFNPHQHSLMGTIRRKPFLTRSCRTQRFNPDQLVIVSTFRLQTCPPFHHVLPQIDLRTGAQAPAVR